MRNAYRLMLAFFIVLSLSFGILHEIGNELDHARNAYWHARQVENLLLPLTVLSFGLLVLAALYETVHWVRARISNWPKHLPSPSSAAYPNSDVHLHHARDVLLFRTDAAVWVDHEI